MANIEVLEPVEVVETVTLEIGSTVSVIPVIFTCHRVGLLVWTPYVVATPLRPGTHRALV
jgi:hypothetical protein